MRTETKKNKREKKVDILIEKTRMRLQESITSKHYGVYF